MFFSYHELRALIDELQREKVRAVALRIEQFAHLIEAELRAPLVLWEAGGWDDPNELHLELIRLLRRTPAVIDVAWVDGSGVQQVKVSRIGRDAVGPGTNWSNDPGLIAARGGSFHVSPIYFRAESEPYAVFAVGGASNSAGVLLAEVNLKFVWEVVSAIKVGRAGYAYVVDAEGRLISHPDLGLVLKKTDLSELPQVRAALASAGNSAGSVSIVTTSADGLERASLTAQASIPLLGWQVIVEQPLAEAFAPFYNAALRTAALLVLGVALAAAAALVLARKMSAPIQVLKESATRIGEGRLHERVEITTGDELQALADQFNQMAGQLRESHSGLEQKIEDRTRELAAANAAKSRFLAIASHDLRQPMHALSLFIAQLKETRGADERERLIEKVEASSDALSELLDALLDISKLDAGVVAAQPVAFDIQVVFDRIDRAFSAAAQAKGLRLRVRPSRVRVMTDPLLLERIVTNLVANAVRYTSEGGVLVACRRRGQNARIEVWDTGAGVPPGELDRVFDEFYQAPAPLAGHAKGLGLGLAIVKRLAKLLSLDVEARSVEGRGSLFAIGAPTSTGAPRPTDGDRAQSPGPMRFDGGLALVVDDDAEAREALAGLLRGWGWRVVIAAGGDQALAALEGEPHLDAVITDYRLADGDLGTRVIERIRAAYGDNIAAIVVSGDVTTDLNESMQSAGLQLLYKPVQAAKLRTLLHHLRRQRGC